MPCQVPCLRQPARAKAARRATAPRPSVAAWTMLLDGAATTPCRWRAASGRRASLRPSILLRQGRGGQGGSDDVPVGRRREPRPMSRGRNSWRWSDDATCSAAYAAFGAGSARRRCRCRWPTARQLEPTPSVPFVTTIAWVSASEEIRPAYHDARDAGTVCPRGECGELVDEVWTLTAPEIYDRLVRRRGWTHDANAAWLSDAVASAVHAHGNRCGWLSFEPLTGWR